jgi:hypothetical protein
MNRDNAAARLGKGGYFQAPSPSQPVEKTLPLQWILHFPALTPSSNVKLKNTLESIGCQTLSQRSHSA